VQRLRYDSGFGERWSGFGFSVGFFFCGSSFGATKPFLDFYFLFFLNPGASRLFSEILEIFLNNFQGTQALYRGYQKLLANSIEAFEIIYFSCCFGDFGDFLNHFQGTQALDRSNR
jgi:hypothetical protein